MRPWRTSTPCSSSVRVSSPGKARPRTRYLFGGGARASCGRMEPVTRVIKRSARAAMQVALRPRQPRRRPDLVEPLEHLEARHPSLADEARVQVGQVMRLARGKVGNDLAPQCGQAVVDVVHLGNGVLFVVLQELAAPQGDVALVQASAVPGYGH